jgi:hypothetical protein
VSGGVAWLATYVTGPVGTIGGTVMLVVGLIQLATGGKDAVGLLVMGAAWLVVGLILLPSSIWKRLRQR